MRLRIVSDGTGPGTKFIDADTGDELDLLVRSFRVYSDISDPRGRISADLTIVAPQIDIETDAVMNKRRKFNRTVDSTGDTEKLREDFGV